MLVFVDESGDPGRKIENGSSRFFVVALVIFEEESEAEAADQRIGLLRRELRINPAFEFRFNKCKETFRTEFLKAVSPYEFFYWGVVIDKDPAKLTGEGFNYKESFYKYTSGLVFQNAKAVLSNATVVIDGSGTKEFRFELDRYLRRMVNSPEQKLIRKVKVQDSKKNNLLQLADMISGSIYRSYGDKPDAQAYRKLVSHREMYVQRWPR
jgi:hypothetical protein